jgi:hypothetical protein
MKYLKYFESQSEPSLKEKLESIVSMYQYLWDLGIGDSLANFTGECSTIFTGFIDNNRGWKSGGKSPYTFKIEDFIKAVDNDKVYGLDRKMETINRLYTLSKSTRFTDTEEDIEKMIRPILDMRNFGEQIIKSHKISRYYNGWSMKPCYNVEIKLNDELFIHSDDQIYDWGQVLSFSTNREEYDDAKSKLREVEKELYQIVRSIKSKANTLNIKYDVEVHTRSSFSNFDSIYLLMIPK